MWLQSGNELRFYKALDVLFCIVREEYSSFDTSKSKAVAPRVISIHRAKS